MCFSLLFRNTECVNGLEISFDSSVQEKILTQLSEFNKISMKFLHFYDFATMTRIYYKDIDDVMSSNKNVSTLLVVLTTGHPVVANLEAI